MISSIEKKLVADDVVRINPATLIGLYQDAKNLPLKSGKISARLSGNYLSAFKGRGMEFDEARPYQPGDDIRSIDWRVTARTGKAYTKLFREERERPVLLWVDYRKPMFFGTRCSFKSVVAAKTAALLAWSAAQHGDRLGGLIFSEQIHQEVRPQRGKSSTLHFIQQLAKHPAWDDYQHTAADEAASLLAMTRLRRVAKPGSLIFMISDFQHFTEKAHAQLAQLSRHNDIVMLFVNDPLESLLPAAGLYRISDGEQELQLDTRDAAMRDKYHERYLKHRNNLYTMSKKLGIFFLDISTEDDLVRTLKKGLGLAKI